MPVFILLNLLLSLLVQTESPYQSLFTGSYTIYSGLVIIVLSIVGALLKQKFYSYWYDLFASGAVLIWFSYWHRFFLYEAPMFAFFPLFFAFFNALLSLLVVGNRDRIDQENIDYFQTIVKNIRFHPVFSAGFVFLSLFLTGHYLLFPIAISFLIISYVLKSCLDISEPQ